MAKRPRSVPVEEYFRMVLPMVEKRLPAASKARPRGVLATVAKTETTPPGVIFLIVWMKSGKTPPSEA